MKYSCREYAMLIGMPRQNDDTLGKVRRLTVCFSGVQDMASAWHLAMSQRPTQLGFFTAKGLPRFRQVRLYILQQLGPRSDGGEK